MSIESLKLELVRNILNTNKESLLKRMAEIFEKETDWWDELSDEERESIDKGLQDAKDGKLIPHEVVMREIKEKYNIK